MGLRGRNDPIPTGERAFIMASNLYALEKGETPIKANAFGKKEEV